MSTPATALLKICLEPARGQGSGCLELDTLGRIHADARLERLPGWRDCLGLACPDPDTAQLLSKATEQLERLWDAERSHVRYDNAHSTALTQLYFNEPKLPWTASVDTLSSKPKTTPAWQGTICLQAGPNRGCLLLDEHGAWKGQGLFARFQGQFEGEAMIDAATPAVIPNESSAPKPRKTKRSKTSKP